MGFNRLITVSSPPAKIARVPFLAPRSPPDTGASIEAQFLADAAAAISTAREGSDVVISTKTPPGRRPERAPCSGSKRTLRTSDGKPTMEKTTSDWEASSRGELARFAPRSSKGWALERVRLKTVRLNPALIRWEHIERPMTPVPIQPRRVVDGVIGSAAVAMERWRTVRMGKRVCNWIFSFLERFSISDNHELFQRFRFQSSMKYFFRFTVLP